METLAIQTQQLTISQAPLLAATLTLPAGTGPFPGVVLAHGLLSCQAEWNDFPERLARSGLAALIFDFRGHGKSAGERGYHTASWHRTDLERAYDCLRERPEIDNSRLALMGHSLGTAAVLAFAAQQPLGCRAIVLVAPPSRLSEDMTPFQRLAYRLGAKVAAPVYRATGIHLHVPYQVRTTDLFFDPACAREAAKLGMIQSSITLNNHQYMVEELDNTQVAPQVSQPALVVVGKEDRVVANTHSREVFEALASQDKEWVCMHQAGHSLMGDAVKAQFAEIVTAWLNNHLA